MDQEQDVDRGSAGAPQRPNVIVILADDLGYSDLGCYGGEIRTENLDRLAESGIRLTQFANTARCSPSRASLLTGLHPHQTGVGILTNDDGPEGYPGRISERTRTLAEMLRGQGYQTAMFGKWHLTNRTHDVHESWPINRGFDRHYGTLGGSGSYYAPNIVDDRELVDRESLPDDFYYTDEISDRAAAHVESQLSDDDPFFLYVAYTAPHWPLHAPAETIDSYDGVFDSGWDALRARRLERMKELGIVAEETELSERSAAVEAWSNTADPSWQSRRMQTYAAQVEIMDRGIGRILEAVRRRGALENTLVIFLSDNGASAEDIPQIEMDEYVKDVEHIIPHGKDGSPMRVGNFPTIPPGPSDTFTSYGPAWANLSNTPFRLYKKWIHQGGIATPFIVHWPGGGLPEGSIVHAPHQLIDVVPTILAACGAEGVTQTLMVPLEGRSFLGELRGDAPAEVRDLFWEHTGNGGVRRGDWKLVRRRELDWELYDLAADPTEKNDVAGDHADLVAALEQAYAAWAQRVGVLPWEVTERVYRTRGVSIILGGG